MDNAASYFMRAIVKIHSFMFVKHSVTLMMHMVGKPMSKLLIPSAEQFDGYLVNKAWGHTSTNAERVKY